MRNMDASRISACTYPLIKEPLARAMEVIAAAGFKKIDLLGRMPHLSLDPAEYDPAAAKAMAQTHGLQIANLGTYVGAGFASEDRSTQERELEQVHRAIDLAVSFGARSIRVRPGNDDAACLERIVPWFQQAARYAAGRGVYMGLENHGGGISGQPRLCAELASRVGSPFFGVLYEPCNLMHAGVDYRYGLHVMREHIVHVHCKDGAYTLAGFQYTMLGQGQIDYPWILAQLDAIGYAGDLALEYEMPEPPPAEALKQWYATFRAMVG